MRLLPPSSRSFHACMGELRDRLDAANELEQNRQELISCSLNSTKIREEQLLDKLNAENEHVVILGGDLNAERAEIHDRSIHTFL